MMDGLTAGPGSPRTHAGAHILHACWQYVNRLSFFVNLAAARHGRVVHADVLKY